MATTTQTRKLYGDEVTLHFNPNSRNRYQLQDGTAPVGVTTVLGILNKPALMMWPMNMALSYIKENYQTFLKGSGMEICLEEASKAHTRKSDKGKDTGSIVHEWIEAFLNYQTQWADVSMAEGGVENARARDELMQLADKHPIEAQKACKAFTNWFNEVKPKVLATEQIVYSREHNYAGTFDALLEIDGKIVLCDVKTSNASRTAPRGVYPENFLQLGAYSLAYQENEGTLGLSPDINPKEWEGVGLRVDDLMIINAGKTGTLSTLRASELGLSVSDCERSWLNVLNIYKFMTPLSKQLKELV